MGVVYEARQVSLNRQVALKVLGPGLGFTARAVERFRHEAEAAARLHHTNIVPVYATGEQDGVHYYAMELIEGPSLDRVLRQLRGPRARANSQLADTAAYDAHEGVAQNAGLGTSSLTSGGSYFDQVAQMVAGVADALDYAHRQGVVHRDVKPGNLLLSPDGRLSLNDFGLARMLEQPGMTQTGEFVGTPLYMAPEQIAAGRAPIDHRADVYSLGATLYEMLTLQPPFGGERRDQVIAQVLHKEPTAPRRVNPKIPVDLETICLKAMEKDPDRRYQSAGQMAEDLRRFVNRFAIAARRAGPIERIRKWARRNPVLTPAVGALLVVFVTAGFFGYQAYQVEQRRVAEERRAALDKALLVALSGNLNGAEVAIAEAERLGALPGQVRFIRGVVSYYAGKQLDAVRHLEVAAELMPDSVAPRAMLATIHGVLGEWEQMERWFREMDAREPKTPEDFLFKSYTVAMDDGRRGLEMLDEEVGRRPSLLGQFLRAQARGRLYMETGQPELAERAAREMSSILVLVPDNPTFLRNGVQVNLAAAGAAKDTGQTQRREEALKEAGRCARELRNHLHLPSAGRNVWLYYRYIGKEDESLDVLQRAAESSDPTSTYAYGLALYHHREPARALEALDHKRGNSEVDMARLFVLCELANGSARAIEAHEELTRRYKEGMVLLIAQHVLRLAGKKPRAVKLCRDYRRTDGFLNRTRSPFFRTLLDYNAGAISEDDLFGAAVTRRHKCYAHFSVGLARLADGDRKSARFHLREAVNTDFYHLFVYDIGRVVLDHLERDPDWPPWIARAG
jgi:tetratricopeptide (TPR) repeat protein